MKFILKTDAQDEIIDITDQVQKAVLSSKIKDGIAVIFAPGTTCGLTIIETEEGMMKDLRVALEKIAPKDGDYEHNRTQGDGNGYSHVRGAFFAGSLSIPVENSELVLGTWQRIVFLEFDNKPRERNIIIKLLAARSLST